MVSNKMIENADIWVNESDFESAYGCCQCMAVEWLCACVSEFSIIIFFNEINFNVKIAWIFIIIGLVIVNVIIITIIIE